MAGDQYASAMADIAQVFMFEQWLRHNYLVEKDGKLFVEIPEADLAEIHGRHEGLGGLADMLNREEISYEKCQDTVCTFVGARFDGSKYGPEVIARTLDSKAFKIEMYVFGVWLKGHESYLDAERLPFADWLEMYDGWKSLDQVKEYRRKLEAGGGDPNAPPSSSVH
ncbi:MAG: hypothetical protein KKA55_05720 [Proteobacteria bacterium]|nr:hypothetical protein [Pseudomonadota bacterium]MBU1595019.1 hypothetical protein [Pseudomonadota bacterium]